MGQQRAASRRFPTEYRWPGAFSEPAILRRGPSLAVPNVSRIVRRCARQFPALGLGICHDDAAAHGRGLEGADPIGWSQHRKLIVHEGTVVRSEGRWMKLPTKFRPAQTTMFLATRSAAYTCRLGADEKPKHASPFEVRSLNNRGRRIHAVEATIASTARRRRPRHDRSVHRRRHLSDVDNPIIGRSYLNLHIRCHHVHRRRHHWLRRRPNIGHTNET